MFWWFERNGRFMRCETRHVRGGDYELVITASDGKRGMTVLRDEHPDVVITDIIMPEQEGIDTIIQIRRERPGIKIIAISGGGRIRNIDFLEMAQSLGADEVIAKPFEADELLNRLLRLGIPAPGDAALQAIGSPDRHIREPQS